MSSAPIGNNIAPVSISKIGSQASSPQITDFTKTTLPPEKQLEAAGKKVLETQSNYDKGRIQKFSADVKSWFMSLIILGPDLALTIVAPLLGALAFCASKMGNSYKSYTNSCMQFVFPGYKEMKAMRKDAENFLDVAQHNVDNAKREYEVLKAQKEKLKP